MRRWMIVLVLLVPSMASAQWIPGSGEGIARPELTLFGGYRDGGRVEGVDTLILTYNFSADLESAASYGFAIDLPLDGNRQLELLASRQKGSLRAHRDLSTGSGNIGDLEVTYLHLGLVQSWFRQSGAVYLGLAAGITMLDPRTGDGKSDTRFSASIAAGAKYFFSHHLGMRVELRGYWTAGNDALSNHVDAVYFGYPSNFLQAEASAGVTLRW